MVISSCIEYIQFFWGNANPLQVGRVLYLPAFELGVVRSQGQGHFKVENGVAGIFTAMVDFEQRDEGGEVTGIFKTAGAEVVYDQFFAGPEAAAEIVIAAFKNAVEGSGEPGFEELGGFVPAAGVDQGGNVGDDRFVVGGFPFVEFPGNLEGGGIVAQAPFDFVGIEEVLGRAAVLKEGSKAGLGFLPGFTADSVLDSQVLYLGTGGIFQETAKNFTAFDLIIPPG
jgi:hypothetical protein